MPDRFYLPKVYPDNPQRPPVMTDIGTNLKIAGIVLQGMGSSLVLLTPSGDPFALNEIEVHSPSLEAWAEILAASDDPQIFVGEVGGVNKVLHRKVRWEISGVTQQRVWARDGFCCCYCGRKMGEVQLTVDHFMPLELGGKNDSSNYLSACRKCGKRKGCMHPEEWCRQRGYDYQKLVFHLTENPFD